MKKVFKISIICTVILFFGVNSASFALKQQCSQVQTIYKQRYIAQKTEVDGVVKEIKYGYRDVPIIKTVCTPVKNVDAKVETEQYYAPKKAKLKNKN